MGITYDTGALIAAERNDRRMWALHAGYLALEIHPSVPAPALVQAWRGGRGQASLARFLRPCTIDELTEPAALRAGALLSWAGRSEVVDAVVIEAALRREDTVVTSDPDDMVYLADAVSRSLKVEVV